MPKFDVVVGNPPYMKNMHLKFLELAVNSLKKDGKIVWIHPARWMQDPLAPIKKGSDFLKYKDLPFVDFKIIPQLEAGDLFNNTITTDLSISYLEKNRISILDEDKIYELRNIPIHFKKILNSNFRSIKDAIDIDKRTGIRVRIDFIINVPTGRKFMFNKYGLFNRSVKIYIDGKFEGKDWCDKKYKNHFTKPIGSPFPMSVRFSTIEEAKNFIDSTNTDFFLFLNYLTKLGVNVQLKYLPFMEDYKQSWTNERFAEHFGVSDKEMEFIKETIKKYKI